MTIELTFDARPTVTSTTKLDRTNETSSSSTSSSTITSSTIHVMRPLTLETLKSICKQEDDHYETMELNDSLRLSYCGIDMLCDDAETTTKTLAQYFPSLKALHADHNQLDQQCFQHVPTSVQSLYINHNAIDSLQTIEQPFTLSIPVQLLPSLELSLTQFPHLITLDISHNPLHSLRGIAGLTQLISLTAHHCELTDTDELVKLTKLRDIDLSFNQLARIDGVINSFQSSVNTLRVVHLSNNPGINEFPQYRRSLLSKFPNIRFMDNRPVSDDEHAAVLAWAEGGFEAEKKVRIDRMEEKRRKHEEQFEAWTAWKSKQLNDHQANSASQMPSIQGNESRRVSIEKRVQYQSVLNEDVTRSEQKHEQSQSPSILSQRSHSIVPPNHGEFNILTSSSADSYLSSVISMLPSISCDSSSDSDEDDIDVLPYLVGLTEISPMESHGSSRLIDPTTHAAVRALLQSSSVGQVASPLTNHSRSTFSTSTASHPIPDKQLTGRIPSNHVNDRDVYTEEHKESYESDDEEDKNDDNGRFRWDGDRIHSISSAESSVLSSRSVERILVISDNDDDEGWTNDLSE